MASEENRGNSQEGEVERFIASNLVAEEFQNLQMLYNYEDYLVGCIGDGRDSIDFLGIPPVSNTYFAAITKKRLSIRNCRNQFITLLTLAARKAIICGVDSRISILIYIFYENKVEMVQEVREMDRLAEEMLNTYARRANKARIDEVPVALRDAVLFIRSRLHMPLTVEEVARHSGRSRSQLDRDFRKYMGTSPQEFILSEKVREAAGFLQYTNCSITELSQDFGFSSPSHFTSTFRRILGVTPREYRKGKRKEEERGDEAEKTAGEENKEAAFLK